MSKQANIETITPRYGEQSPQHKEPVRGFGGNAYVTEATGPDTARCKVLGHAPVHCYVQRDKDGRLCAVRRVLISDIAYA